MMRVFGLMLKAVVATAIAAAAVSAFIGTAGGAAASEPGELASLAAEERGIAEAARFQTPLISSDNSVRRVVDQKVNATPQPKVTREQAEAIALKRLPGRVTSVEIEPKRGKLVYAVEIMTPQGEETDVLVDTETGEILGMEN